MSIEITYVQKDGARKTVSGREGVSLMQLAVDNDVPSIEGMCGGVASCGTCHCQLPQDAFDALPLPSSMEADMLECLDEVTPTSRLGCQVKLTPALAGLEVLVLPAE